MVCHRTLGGGWYSARGAMNCAPTGRMGFGCVRELGDSQEHVSSTARLLRRYAPRTDRRVTPRVVRAVGGRGYSSYYAEQQLWNIPPAAKLEPCHSERSEESQPTDNGIFANDEILQPASLASE